MDYLTLAVLILGIGGIFVMAISGAFTMNKENKLKTSAEAKGYEYGIYYELMNGEDACVVRLLEAGADAAASDARRGHWHAVGGANPQEACSQNMDGRSPANARLRGDRCRCGDQSP